MLYLAICWPEAIFDPGDYGENNGAADPIYSLTTHLFASPNEVLMILLIVTFITKPIMIALMWAGSDWFASTDI
ncbi:hypothetical protein CUJ83_12900 [Methanocella sp. CWC-04]|uniref:Uncharacterized protein n=1 Tax=Methanooceanicella nereidis TaxID=2052831 RepID=A0AAP2RDX8_9EURY|nr:hypothetical protein [Methanocella sp. CWC-04]